MLYFKVNISQSYWEPVNKLSFHHLPAATSIDKQNLFSIK